MSNKITKYKMFINGEWVDADSGETTTVIDPSNEEPIATVPKAGPSDVKKPSMPQKKRLKMAGEIRHRATVPSSY